MNNLRIIIVEDNLPYAADLEINLIAWGYEVLGVYDNGKDALEHIKKYRPDLILMDIDIKGHYDGIEIGKKIQPLDIPIIFMTGLKQVEVFEESLKTKGISYLIKPFDLLSLKGAIAMAYPKSTSTNLVNSNEQKVLFVKRGNEYHSVLLSLIDYIEVDKNYCTIFSGQKKYIQKTSIKSLLLQLDSDQMIRIHRSYVIQLKDIEKISLSKNEVTISGRVLPIGRSYKENLLKRLNMLN